MVQRQWLLLVYWATGCSVETLNIHVPKRGVASIHQEDLRRAVWRLQLEEDPVNWWARRIEQLHLVTVPGNPSCFTHSSDYESGVRLYLEEQNPVSLAVLASWAKAMDQSQRSIGWQFCLQNPIGGVESNWRDVPLSSLFPIEDQSFTDIQFDQLEEQLRIVVTQHWEKQ